MSSDELRQWQNDKQFLKVSDKCPNKEKINFAVEKLLQDANEHQVNIVKRLVEYFQDELNRLYDCENRVCKNCDDTSSKILPSAKYNDKIT